MARSAIIAVAVAIAAGAAAGAAQAQSSTSVLGGGMAQACSEAARAQVRANDARRGRAKVALTANDGLLACDRALATEVLQIRDLAATYVNRGVLLMARSNYAAALADYDKAVRMRPKLAEAHANRGAALIALGRYPEGVAEITTGLELQTEFPEKSYYNRAMGRERLDDFKGAYLDFMKASELKPDWEEPRLQLTRFTLTPK